MSTQPDKWTRWVRTDGGRAAAGYKGDASGDCTIIAISVATGKSYREVHDALCAVCMLLNRPARPTRGVPQDVTQFYLRTLGWEWVELRQKARRGDLPMGRLIVAVPKHLVAVIDHVVHDSYDSWRGLRRVDGFFRKAAVS